MNQKVMVLIQEETNKYDNENEIIHEDEQQSKDGYGTNQMVQRLARRRKANF